MLFEGPSRGRLKCLPDSFKQTRLLHSQSKLRGRKSSRINPVGSFSHLISVLARPEPLTPPWSLCNAHSYRLRPRPPSLPSAALTLVAPAFLSASFQLCLGHLLYPLHHFALPFTLNVSHSLLVRYMQTCYARARRITFTDVSECNVNVNVLESS